MRSLNRAIIIFSGMFKRSHMSMALGENSCRRPGRRLSQMTSKKTFRLLKVHNSVCYFLSPVQILSGDNQGVASVLKIGSSIRLSTVSAPSLSPGKIMQLHSQGLHCVAAHGILDYFCVLDLFGFYINNLIHLSFPPPLDTTDSICLTLF